ncbi:MAG: UPF0158 family protein [Nocardioidaceae bacterium]
MAPRWQSIEVVLLGGRQLRPWPPPGRLFVVGPRHTFAQFAQAINAAFARWDLSHLSQFTLVDGREMTCPDDEDTSGPGFTSDTRVFDVIEPGETFRFVFDFGDRWVHRCTVGAELVDPLEVYGVTPHQPTAYFGWGDLPDQYGRRWPEDDGTSPLPPRPQDEDPMLGFGWPLAPDASRVVDERELRGAIASGDVERVLAALRGKGFDRSNMQRVGAGLLLAVAAGRNDAHEPARDLVGYLRARDWEGDDALVAELLAALGGEVPEGKVLSVGLEEFTDSSEGDVTMSEGCYVDLETGEVLDAFLGDPMIVGEDAVVDFDEPGRYQFFDNEGSREGWRDMDSFVATVDDPAVRERLQDAITGRGAFRRFKDAIYDVGRQEEWYLYSCDRQMARARARLAEGGIRVRPSL